MMKKIYKQNETIYRVLAVDGSKSFVIDCVKASMPKWIEETFESFEELSEDDLRAYLGVYFDDVENLSPKGKKTMYERYTLISGALSLVKNEAMRSMIIDNVSNEQGISKKTLRRYLCSYLVFQDIRALAPVENKVQKELSKDEKNIRWALNKFFYNKNKNSLKYAYTNMIKEKYCDSEGKLLETYPSFYQFRYFYRKTKKLETYYISRDGIKNYQKNNRPLLGDGIQEFAPMIGTAMLDSTICDIYLINEKNQIVGRPVLTAAIDSFSGLCLGYSLTWEGGIYSLRNLMLNVISDKKEHCKKFGIEINVSEWNCSSTFNACVSLKNIIFPSTLEIVEDSCFTGCKSLLSLDIPANITSFNSSFGDCDNMKAIYVHTQEMKDFFDTKSLPVKVVLVE